MMPWYRGYTGEISIQPNRTYKFTGKYKVTLPNKLEITELPIKKWTREYKTYLEELAQNNEIDEIKEYHKDNTIRFVLTVPGLKSLIEEDGAIEKKFKLTSTFSGNNYVLFDKDCRIKKYEDEVQILEEFYPIRYNLYLKRKNHMLAVMQN